MDFNTEKNAAFKGDQGEANTRSKFEQKDNLRNTGNMDFRTDKNDAYRGRSGEAPVRARANDNLHQGRDSPICKNYS
jgi:hypothetical protein